MVSGGHRYYCRYCRTMRKPRPSTPTGDAVEALEWIKGFDFEFPHLSAIQKTIIAALQQMQPSEANQSELSVYLFLVDVPDADHHDSQDQRRWEWYQGQEREGHQDRVRIATQHF